MILEKTIDARQLLTCQVIVLIWSVVMRETALGLQDLSGLLESGDVLCILDGHDLMVPSSLRPEMRGSYNIAHRVPTIQAFFCRLVIVVFAKLALVPLMSILN